MYIEVSDRQTGKTTRLLQRMICDVISEEVEVAIVMVPDRAAAHRIADAVKRINAWFYNGQKMRIIFVVSKRQFYEMIDFVKNQPKVKLYVDDAEHCRFLDILIGVFDNNNIEQIKNLVDFGYYCASERNNEIDRLIELNDRNFCEFVCKKHLPWRG